MPPHFLLFHRLLPSILSFTLRALRNKTVSLPPDSLNKMVLLPGLIQLPPKPGHVYLHCLAAVPGLSAPKGFKNFPQCKKYAPDAPKAATKCQTPGESEPALSHELIRSVLSDPKRRSQSKASKDSSFKASSEYSSSSLFTVCCIIQGCFSA